MELLLSLLLLASAQVWQPRTGDQLAAALASSGLPVTSVLVRTAETDPNELLGRPHQYTAKISWSDARYPGVKDSCCTVEAFDDWHDYIARINYIRWVQQNAPPVILAGEWIEHSDASMSVMRLSKAITPDAAAQYRAWLLSL